MERIEVEGIGRFSPGLADELVRCEATECLEALDYAVSPTDRLCRGGAAVKNLAHSASFHSWEKIAPSKPGIKHLESACGYLFTRSPVGSKKARKDASAG